MTVCPEADRETEPIYFFPGRWEQAGAAGFIALPQLLCYRAKAKGRTLIPPRGLW